MSIGWPSPSCKRAKIRNRGALTLSLSNRPPWPLETAENRVTTVCCVLIPQWQQVIKCHIFLFCFVFWGSHYGSSWFQTPGFRWFSHFSLPSTRTTGIWHTSHFIFNYYMFFNFNLYTQVLWSITLEKHIFNSICKLTIVIWNKPLSLEDKLSSSWKMHLFTLVSTLTYLHKIVQIFVIPNHEWERKLRINPTTNPPFWQHLCR